MHLIPEEGSLQLVSKEAHKIKSYSERMGISFEEAFWTKTAIDLIKTKIDKAWLEERNIVPASNQKARREQILEVLRNE